MSHGVDNRQGEQRWLLALALSAAIAGCVLRALHLFTEPLWLDEAYSAYAAGKDLHFLWHVVPSYETHPPFYYTLLHFWEAPFGDSLPALRALGLVAGLATPPALAWSASRIGRLLGVSAAQRLPLIATAFILACVSIPMVEMSREVRPYPLMILLYALATGVLATIAGQRRNGRPLGSGAFVAYLLILVLMLWLHNLGPLWAVAMGLALIAAIVGHPMRAADWLWFLGGHILVALVYLPGLLILLDQAPTWVHSTWVTFTPASLWDRLAMLYAVPGWQSLAAAVLALLGIAGLWRRGGDGRRVLAILIPLALVPTLLSIGLTIGIAPVFITRTLTPIAAPTLLLLALGAVLWSGRTAWVGLAATAMLAANMIAVDIQARSNGPMQDWYPPIHWLEQRFRPGDQILAYPNEGALPIERAIRDKGHDWPVRPIPGPMPANDPSGWHPTGSRGVVSLPQWRLHQIASEPATQAVPTIWLLRLGAKTYDPGDVFLQELSQGRRVVARWPGDPIQIVGLRKR